MSLGVSSEALPPTAAVRSLTSAAVGDSFSLAVCVTDRHIDEFAALSGDYNPLHVNTKTATAQGFSARVAHGLLITCWVSRLLGMEFPGRDCLLESVSVDFVKPVCSGDKIVITITVAQIQPALRTVVLKILASRGDEVVVRGKAIAQFMKESIPK